MRASVFSFFALWCFCLTQAQITFDVQEEQPAPVLLGNIAKSANITYIPDLDFSLLSRKDLFSVDDSTGDFKTIAVLDRESLCGSVPSCVLTTSVAVSSSPDFFQRYTVNVTVVDANDQRPDFGITNFPSSLSERATINTTIKLPVANDGDYEPAFKVQKYSLEPEYHDTFDLIVQRHNRSDGSVQFDLYLRLKQKLDRESVSSYTLTLVASDFGSASNQGRLQITITVNDENDNEPEFPQSKYSISIKEITQVGTTLATISATDADDGENGRVGYEFPNNIDRRVLDYFEIDRVSGAVKLLKSLEKEGAKTFTFKVKAFDHGTPMMSSEVNMEISVEDTVNDPPSISISHFRSKGTSAVISEDAMIGTKVAFIDVTDTDSGRNGETRCTATSEFFTMKEYTSPGVYTMSVARDLDREKVSSHLISIQCVDRGTPPLSSTAKLSVLVEDVNDNRPLFTRKSYEMRVKENQEAGEPVGNVFATDADDGVNSVLRYSLEPGTVQFEINESNGFIYTAMKNLDRELRDRYIFHVYAFDTSSSPLTATATVIVNIEDVNDEWPRFENSTYLFLVSESTKLNSVIGKVHATDFDLGPGGMVEYLFVHSPTHPNPPFTLSKEDGTITLTNSLDYEMFKRYNFVVTAVDFGKPPRNSSVEVDIEVLDENDNNPIIAFPNPENLSVTLNLDVSPGQEIIRVIAHDSDSGERGRLTYSISAHNSSASRLFWVNEDTGLMTLVAPLTQADIRSYNIVISVNDNGIPQRATQALLHIEITQQGHEKRLKESYTTIVIVMVCVTLFVAVIVLVTLCFIKYIDKRKFNSERSVHKAAFEPMNKTAEDYIQAGGGDEDLEQGSVQKKPIHYQTDRLVSSIRNGKKSVTFDSDIRSSDASTMSEVASTQPDSGFSSVASTFNSSSSSPVPYSSNFGTGFNSPRHPSSTMPYSSNLSTGFNSPRHPSSPVPHFSNTGSTFHPESVDSYSTNIGVQCSHSPLPSPSGVTGTSSVPFFYNISRTNGGSTPLFDNGACVSTSTASKEEFDDQVVDVALQKHNALIRSMRNSDRKLPYASRQTGNGINGHDPDLCSSSSMETSDSGHGGSELDVSVIKANV